MSKVLAELRVVAKHKDRYASVGYLKLEKNGDIYYGPEINFTKKLGHKEVFRNSYHRDGTRWFRALGKPEKDGIFESPLNLKGIMELGQLSPNLNDAAFLSEIRKPDTKVRRSLIVDLQDVFPNGFTAPLFAFEPGRSDLFYDQIQARGQFRTLGSVVADWCTPNLGIYAWTMTSEQWATLDQAIADLDP